jgi:hypothetical protein
MRGGDWPAPEHVRAAAQLDATMHVLESIEDVRRELDALRMEIRPRSAPLPVGVIIRVVVEAAILIAVAVVAGVGGFRPLLTIALMAMALAAVILSEWFASRSAYVPRSFGFAQAAVLDAPAETALESDAWERPFFPEPESVRSV